MHLEAHLREEHCRTFVTSGKIKKTQCYFGREILKMGHPRPLLSINFGRTHGHEILALRII